PAGCARVTSAPLFRAPDGDGGWWLKLAVRHAPGRWLLARLRTTELDRMIRDLDSGSGGHVTVLDASGVLLARAPVGRRGPFVGRSGEHTSELQSRENL